MDGNTHKHTLLSVIEGSADGLTHWCVCVGLSGVVDDDDLGPCFISIFICTLGPYC